MGLGDKMLVTLSALGANDTNNDVVPSSTVGRDKDKGLIRCKIDLCQCDVFRIGFYFEIGIPKPMNIQVTPCWIRFRAYLTFKVDSKEIE